VPDALHSIKSPWLARSLNSLPPTSPPQPHQAVLTPSAPLPAGTPVIRGWDFNDGATLDGIMAAMLTTGCQATALGQAVVEVNRMVRE
jgi:hypothetical protein